MLGIGCCVFVPCVTFVLSVVGFWVLAVVCCSVCHICFVCCWVLGLGCVGSECCANVSVVFVTWCVFCCVCALLCFGCSVGCVWHALKGKACWPAVCVCLVCHVCFRLFCVCVGVCVVFWGCGWFALKGKVGTFGYGYFIYVCPLACVCVRVRVCGTLLCFSNLRLGPLLFSSLEAVCVLLQRNPSTQALSWCSGVFHPVGEGKPLPKSQIFHGVRDDWGLMWW